MVGTLRSRSRKLGLDVDGATPGGALTIQKVDPSETSAGQFATMVRWAAQGKDGHDPARMIIIDSLNGYLNAMAEDRFLTAQLHELLAYLSQQGIATILTVTQSGLVGNMQSPVDTTYLADNVILLRFFEAAGQVRRAISVMKKRNGAHERSIREFAIHVGGLQIGAPLSEFHGILTGVPTYTGPAGPLLKQPSSVG
jgi:circadian clock protein KaiC